MKNFELTDEEVAHITARRDLATEAERKRLAEDRPFDLDDIKPGMNPADAQRAADAIRKAWGF